MFRSKLSPGSGRLAHDHGKQRNLISREVIAAFEHGFIEEPDLWQSLSTRRTAHT